ncbi:leucyl aminopeptidase [Acidithiobacillus caldus]|uniref:Probable cytosol aminopeptidase n=2 Tax=Acidithiobacillus caldus TaxID=33059 RepID=A0A059ZXJ0_ACICK|nr:leucyl aminopeptidase [Acidithiobacillus caldus]AIA54632.1 Cytosol aminopeptidase PepA [Acidithiobacillus caldus ATCC 51756]AUW32119.1 leucyl aminopeptidase [Acidithiobacillus caldus]MBU2728949.1 leucyl aminopeptidase [Acidithiobacillus caldus]MBU2735873.1 leucyl aminopeptidase [Acidithiobacillus caldus ATCC 51756]MBU2745998.1 leucyl aminopeptidase [Acidithiobacillus caldus]
MEIVVRTVDPCRDPLDCLIVPLFADGDLPKAAAAVNEAGSGALKKRVEQGDFRGECGQTLTLYDVPGIQAARLLLVGVGKSDKISALNYQKAMLAAGRALADKGVVHATLLGLDLDVPTREPAALAEIAVQAIADGQYRFDHHKAPAETARRELQTLTLAVDDHLAPQSEAIFAAADAARITSEAAAWARDLANEPGNVCTPTWLAEQAEAMASSRGIEAEILGPAQMEELGMQLLLGVAQGSRQEPRLIVLHYRGADSAAAPLVLVGKGLTFDAGGISLKPADKMDEMKYDMCGGATALAAIRAAADLRLPLNLSVVVPASENLPDGKATKPGDIHKSMSGLTVEILNTDAEGRLILADALTYARRFKPAAIIDMATLTGACIIALGHQTAAVLGTDATLVQDLLEAGRQSLDRAWELPLFEVYHEQLKSPFADLSNVGGRPAGTITAACFLSRFVEDIPWAHLDIAGVAWKSGEHKGATGRPVPLLVEYLRRRASKPR